MSYRVTFSGRAKKELMKLPPQQRQLLLAWINNNLEQCENPRKLQEARPIKGTQCGWRFKVGAYRILASIFDDELIIHVVRVGHRQGVYGHLPKL